jgi:hypothetical protein
MAFK